MRAFGLAVLLLLCASGLDCKSSGSSKSDPAGNVVGLRGEASASSSQHGDRKLAVGDLVYRDDRIATFAETAIEIRLLHNGALWTLRGAREIVVADSPAWRAERASADLLDPNSTVDKTGAAGRHGEREAAEDPSGLPEVAEAAVAAEPSEPAPDVPDSFADKDDSEDKEVRGGLGTIGTVGGGGGSGSGKGSGTGSGQGSVSARVESRGAEVRLSVSAATGPLNKAVVTRLLRARRGAIAQCAKDTRSRGRLSLQFTISEQGTVQAAAIELAGDAALLRELGSCLEEKLAAMTAPVRDGETLVRALVEVGEP